MVREVVGIELEDGVFCSAWRGVGVGESGMEWLVYEGNGNTPHSPRNHNLNPELAAASPAREIKQTNNSRPYESLTQLEVLGLPVVAITLAGC